MINSRDLFEQIGFVVDSPAKASSFNSKGRSEYR